MNEESEINRIDRIIEAAEKAIVGDFSCCVEPSGKNDKLDRLAGAINQIVVMLKEHGAAINQTENLTRNGGERYRRLEANIPGLVYLFVMHPDGSYSFSYVNDVLQTLFNIVPEDLLRDANLLLDLIHPDDREKFESTVKQSAASLQPWRETLRAVVNEDVRWFECMSRPELYANGDILWNGIMLEITDRVKTTVSLKESEQRLANIISASPVGISIFDASGECIMANDSLAHMVGGTRQQLLSQNYKQLASWKDSGLLDVAEVAMKTKTTMRHEVITQSSFGKDLFFDCHLVPFGSKELLYMGQDITARKLKEKALLESESRLKSVFRAVPAGIGVAVDRVFKQVNRRLCEMTGYTEGDLLNQNARMLYTSDAEYERVGHMYTQTRGQEIISVETQWRCKDGHIIDILLNFTLTPIEELQEEVTFSALDITDRKRAETALKFIQFAVDKIGDLAFWMTEDGSLIYVNDAACSKLGYSKEELLTMSISDIGPEFPPEVFAEHWQELRKTGSAALETIHRTKDGRIYPVDVRANHVVFDGKEYNCAFVTDITDRKALEEKLRQSQKMEAIGQLAGGVAHDFNNMLQGIIGYAEVVLASPGLDEKNRKRLLEVCKASEKAADLTRQLLAFSRRQVLRLETLDVNLIVNDLLKMLYRLIDKKIKLSFYPEKELWLVKADRGQIEQVLMNLCLNARDAMPKGGQVIIETQNVTFDTQYCIQNKWATAEKYIQLNVTDSGCGIDLETQGKIFEPFFTTQKQNYGTGLGLSTVYGIVRQHDGMIHVHSEIEKGSRFSVYLPEKNEAI